MKGNGKESDARAVENPITDMFKLSEGMYDLVPELKRMILYSYFYLGSTLLIIFFFLLVFLVNNLFLFMILLFMFIIGIVSFSLLRKLNGFIKYFSIRHKAIKAVYEEHEVSIPRGDDPVERAITYVSQKDSRLKDIIKDRGLKRNHTIKAGGSIFTFDGFACARPAIMHTLFASGDPGYSLFIKNMKEYPTLMQLMDFDSAVTKSCKALGIVPSRAIIVVTGAKKELDDAVYESVLASPIVVKSGLFMSERFTCSVQIITESPDGKYDFIPFMPIA
jgi:hypothetical protein